jgi:hypothetical protein
LASDRYAAVSGFLTPDMVGADPRGRVLNAFSNPRDIDMISKGYACGNCCATFYSFQLNCPVCGLATNVSGARQDTPADWQAHVNARGEEIPTGGPGDREPIPDPRPQTPRSVDEFIAAVAGDPDVEQVSLSKLHKRVRRKP